MPPSNSSVCWPGIGRGRGEGDAEVWDSHARSKAGLLTRGGPVGGRTMNGGDNPGMTALGGRRCGVCPFGSLRSRNVISNPPTGRRTYTDRPNLPAGPFSRSRTSSPRLRRARSALAVVPGSTPRRSATKRADVLATNRPSSRTASKATSSSVTHATGRRQRQDVRSPRVGSG
jgi:hypothetical protein